MRSVQVTVMYPRGDESHEAKWPRGRIQTETYGFACQKTRCWSLNLILISCMSFRGDFRPERASERVTRITPGYSVENPWLGGDRGFESYTVAQSFDTPRQSVDEMFASMFIKVIAP